MSKNLFVKRLEQLVGKEVQMKERVMHSASSAQPFAGCKGTLLKVKQDSDWEPVIVLVDWVDQFGRHEDMWINPLDLVLPERALFNEIRAIVKTKENYIPRNYQTIGGMWTVDTWKKGDVTFQQMDEGYTDVIHTDTVRIIDGWIQGKQAIWFEHGGVEELQAVLDNLKGDAH